MQALESKTDGRWRPSPGSVYPSLQMLADEDLVTSTERDGKRTFEITDAGRAHADERVATSGYPPRTEHVAMPASQRIAKVTAPHGIDVA